MDGDKPLTARDIKEYQVRCSTIDTKKGEIQDALAALKKTFLIKEDASVPVEGINQVGAIETLSPDCQAALDLLRRISAAKEEALLSLNWNLLLKKEKAGMLF